MIDFLIDNWQFVAAIGCGIIEVIILLFTKKRPQIVDNSFLFNCSEWVLAAEKMSVSGEEKMSFVLSKAKDYLEDNFNEKAVREIVEWILSLPEKKEK